MTVGAPQLRGPARHYPGVCCLPDFAPDKLGVFGGAAVVRELHGVGLSAPQEVFGVLIWGCLSEHLRHDPPLRPAPRADGVVRARGTCELELHALFQEAEYRSLGRGVRAALVG